METNRQKKIGGILQEDIATVIQELLRERGVTNIIISVTKVRVTTDLSDAQAYVSIFPSENKKTILTELQELTHDIKHRVALKIKDQMRRMPELSLRLDDSLDYIEGIDNSLKRTEDPIRDRSLLKRRKQS